MATLYEERKKGRKDPADAVYIRELEAPAKGQRLVYDQHKDAPRGFGLRVTTKGTVAFILRYFAEGKDRRLTIGEWPTWSLVAARKQAGEYKREIDTGHDILEERRQERRVPTVAQSVEDYCKAHVDNLTSGPAVRSCLERYFVAAFGKQKIKDIRRRDVIAAVEKVAEQYPRQAALLLTHVKGLFAWAEDRELIDANPAATLKPRKVGRSLAPRARARVLDDDEIRTLWTKAEGAGLHRLTALALKLILVTGQRPGEVAGMTWSEIQGNVWTIPEHRRGKTQTAHVVPLTTTAQEVLDAAKAEVKRLSKRRKAKPCGYVFETRPGSCPAVNALDRAVKRYAEALGNKDAETWGHWTPHDLRRAMRTGLSAARVSETVAELTIGHTRKGIAAVYDLHAYDAEKRAALEAWECRLLQIVEGQPIADNVVSIAGDHT